MSESINTSLYEKSGKISFECALVAAVFFIIYSQFVVFIVSETVTMFFRPVLIAVLLVQMVKRGVVHSGTRAFALTAAVYCALVVLLNDINSKELLNGGAVVLYLLMFATVIGTPWNRREISFIIFACFIGAFVCAVVLFTYNPITDFHAALNGDLTFMGGTVNRNRNTYAFSVGTIIGTLYLMYGKRKPKLLVLLMTAFLAYGVAYSQCRGSFYCLVAAELVIIGGRILSIGKKNAGKALLYTLAVIALCIIGYILLKNSELSRLVDGESTSGREVGIKNAWEMFATSDLFGKIFGNGYLYEAAHSDTIGAHMVFAAYLVSTGIIGCGLIIMIFISSMLRIRSNAAWAFLVFAFIRCFFEGLDYYIYIPLILAHIINNYSLIYGRKENELFGR